eukprot:CAMPEP_0176440856 /NCGR_PEP_ID=MMETSP0127-20121128/20832_1 /TAXON_ID=938130 /ORGANISM="Platyophrya macrostoma, Strain WH" /LENGTH=137 /DNA_ID=CAMNT_0017825485 /DNA_START=62 /DNA_END=475 /DNA_ORIENTATION=+
MLARYAATSALLNKGKVVSWMSGRGFGFIEDDADKKQHFVHNTALKVEAGGFRALTVGQEVEYDVVTVDGRTKADNVMAPGGANLPPGTRPPPQDNFRQGGGRGFGGGRGRGRGFGGGRGRGGFNDEDYYFKGYSDF